MLKILLNLLDSLQGGVARKQGSGGVLSREYSLIVYRLGGIPILGGFTSAS
jgi:hypothetical protein